MADAKPEEGPVEHVAVTGRPQDTPTPNTTFAERAAARQPKKKAVQEAENKSVSSSRASRKSK